MNAQHVLIHEKQPYARITPPCPYFGTCGGCSLQDLGYADQLALKQERLRRAFEPFAVTSPIELIGMDDPWRYRNKAELTFGESDGQIVLGYHVAGSFQRLVDLDDCLLLPEAVTRMLGDVRHLAAETGLRAYHPKSHRGFFRYLVVRSSRRTGQVLVCLVTAPGSREPIESLARELVKRHPVISSFYWGVSARLADAALPEELHLIQGAPCLEDQVGSFRVELHPLSFLQPNTPQAEHMYEVLCRSLPDGAHRLAWDLYCGVGLVAFHLSTRYERVYGIELEPGSIELAHRCAALNGLSNIEFRQGRVEVLLDDRRFWLQEAKPDVIVADPPRAGLHPRALASIVSARPQAIAYLSCNVQSLIRDLSQLRCGFPRYRITSVQAFDMFPQTHHIEVLTLLER